MNRERMIKDLLADCPSFSVSDLEALTYEQLANISGVDVNWCYDEKGRNEYSDEYVTEDAAVSRALYAQYEEITKYA